MSKLKTAVKNNEATTLRISTKMFNSDNLPQKIFLTTTQTTKLRNAIENDISSDINLSKSQIKKIILSGGNLESLLSKLAGLLMKVAVPAPLRIAAAMSGIDGAIQ